MKKLTLIALLTVAIASCESANNQTETGTIDTQAVTVDTISVYQATDSVKSHDSVTAPLESTSLKVSK